MRKVLILMAIISFGFFSGCNLQEDNPLEETTPTQSARDFLNRPANPCSSYDTVDVKNMSGNIIGHIELVNDQEDLYVIFKLDHGYVLKSYNCYAGRQNQVPSTGNSIKYEAFPYQMTYERPRNAGVIKIPVRSLNVCPRVLFHGKIEEMDLWGNTLAKSEALMTGVPYKDGFTYEKCIVQCVPGGSSR